MYMSTIHSAMLIPNPPAKKAHANQTNQSQLAQLRDKPRKKLYSQHYLSLTVSNSISHLSTSWNFCFISFSFRRPR